MARARTLRPTFFTHDYLATCDPLIAILFAGLWTEADRMGRLEDRPVQLKMRLLPMRPCDVVAMLAELEQHGLIARYTGDDGRAYIWIPGFVEQQRGHIHPDEAASKLPRHPRDTNEETAPKPKTGSKGGRNRPRTGSEHHRKVVARRSGSSGSSGSSIDQDLQDLRSATTQQPSRAVEEWEFLEAARSVYSDRHGLGLKDDPRPDYAAITQMVSRAFKQVGSSEPHSLAELYEDHFLGGDFARDKGWPLRLFLTEGCLGVCLSKAAKEAAA